MAYSKLQVLRSTNKAATTANETAASNSVTLPPGLYDIEVVVPGATTGSPTSVKIEIQDSADGVTYASLEDPRVHTLTLAAEAFFFRGVRIKQFSGTANNVGAKITVAGGSSPSTPSCFIVAHTHGMSRSYNGQP